MTTLGPVFRVLFHLAMMLMCKSSEHPIFLRNGHVEIVRLLADSAQSADAGALHIAARKGHVEAGIGANRMIWFYT